MIRISITENEVYPEYCIEPVDPAILAEYPDAGFEVDQAFVNAYRRARAEWNDVQAKLGELLRQKESRP